MLCVDEQKKTVTNASVINSVKVALTRNSHNQFYLKKLKRRILNEKHSGMI